MATPFSSFLSSLQAPSYSGVNLGSYIPNKKKNTPTANMTSVKTGRPAVGSVSSAPGATPARSTPITAAKSGPSQTTSNPVIQTPAAQSYIQSQLPPSNINIGSLGNTDVSSPSSTPTTAPKKNDGAYLEYMRSLFNPAELDRQQKERERINKEVLDASQRLGEIQTRKLSAGLEGREAQEARLDKTGGTTSGATTAAGLIGRRSSADLARIGVEEAGAAASLAALTGAQQVANDTYAEMINAGATIQEAEEAARQAEIDAIGEGFTLGKDQYRYDAQGNLIASGPNSANAFGGGIYTPGTDPVADSWVKLVQEGKAKIDNVPEELRGAVAQGVANRPASEDPKAKYVISQADEALTNIDTVLGYLDNPEKVLLSESALGRAVGGLLPGGSVASMNAAKKTIQALVGFDALQKMRESSPTGGALGQITERELAFLQSVQGSLDNMQNTQQLIDTVKRIQKSFLTLKLINSPDGTPFELEGEVYYKLGDQLVPEGSFSSVGNTSASNRPQRNNNPGNIKKGGIADRLAIGQDTQGHLIFPSPEIGFQALQMDLQAKLTGRSSQVGPNPTIAQLGRAWAEDPNWANAVSKILGVSPNTPASSINFSNLAQAIARQEGYYA